MSAEFRVDASETVAMLEEMERRFAEPGEFLADVQLDLEEHMRDHFQEEMGPDGAWASLSEKYAAWKAMHYPGMPILQRDGHLIGDIGGAVEGNTAMAFTEDPVGVFHDEGTATMSQRSYGWMSEEFMDGIEAKVEAYWGGD